jgi:predicted N-formylglutamate amidohydrolase
LVFDPIIPSPEPLALDGVIEPVATGDSLVATKSPFVLYSIHDGDLVPPVFAADATGEVFARERDFGADAVAESVARALGVGSRLRVRLARSVLDAGRSFGCDDGRAGHTSRLAVPAAIASHADRESLSWLERAHARIEETIAGHVATAGPSPIAIGIHTYDPVNADGTARPELSLLDLPESVARGALDFLPRATAVAANLDRLMDALARHGFTVRRNDPYLLPDGSLEVRLHQRARRESWPNRDRLQAFVLEIRKDLICDGRHANGYFAATAIRLDAVRALADRVALALSALAHP